MFIRYTTRGRHNQPAAGTINPRQAQSTRGRHNQPAPPAGLFQTAYALRDEQALPADRQRELEERLRAYESAVRELALECYPDAICWYKPGASEALTQTRSLADFLSRQGFAVHVEERADPGFIIDEDDVQAAAMDCGRWRRLGYLIGKAKQQAASHFFDTLLRVLGKRDEE